MQSIPQVIAIYWALGTIKQKKHFYLKLDNNMFSRVFISSVYKKFCFDLCHWLFVVNDTFLMGKFILTLLLAVKIDANGESIILAWVIVESKNVDSWKYFFHSFCLAMGNAFLMPIVAIFDWDKSLNYGLKNLKLLDTFTYFICCQYLKKNIIKEKEKNAIASHFWSVARAKIKEKFHYHMTKLQKVSVLAAAYFKLIDFTFYAKIYVFCQQFSIDTSNIIEFVNSSLK